MNSTTDPYCEPSQTGYNYNYTVPKVWNCDKWYVNQYPTPVNTPWCCEYFNTSKYDEKQPDNDFSYGELCPTLSQNVAGRPAEVSPLYYLLAGTILYKYLYR